MIKIDIALTSYLSNLPRLFETLLATYIVCTFMNSIFGGFAGKETGDICYYL